MRIVAPLFLYILLTTGFADLALADPAVSLGVSPAVSKEIRVSVKGMVCAFCAQGITKKFKREPSVSHVEVSLEKKFVTIETKGNEDLSDEKINQILKDSGYSVERIERQK